MNLFDLVVTKPIFNLLLSLYQLIGDFGVAIIIFTVIVKLILWPLSIHAIEQSKKMREIQPELQRIRKESKGNKTIEAMRTMEVYRKNDIKMFRSMVIMVAQAIIFITLFSVLNTIVNHPKEVSKYTYTPVSQFSKVEELKNNNFTPKLFGVVNLSERAATLTSKSSYFLLFAAIIAALTQYYTIKKSTAINNKGKKTIKEIFKEAASGKEPNQSEMNMAVANRMSSLMPILMFFATINLYGALTFYYFINGVLTAVQQKYIFDIRKNNNKEKKIQEAQIIDKPKNKKSNSTNIRRIKANDKKRSK